MSQRPHGAAIWFGLKNVRMLTLLVTTAARGGNMVWEGVCGTLVEYRLQKPFLQTPYEFWQKGEKVEEVFKNSIHFRFVKDW